jgi:hypothetical protein
VKSLPAAALALAPWVARAALSVLTFGRAGSLAWWIRRRAPEHAAPALPLRGPGQPLDGGSEGGRNALRGALSAALVACVAATGSPALARDYCLDTGAATFVLTGFKMPRKGRCAAVGGWIVSSLNKEILSGTACTFADGSELRIALHATGFPSTPAFDDGLFENDFSFVFDLPALTGMFLNRGLTFGLSSVSPGLLTGPASAAPCERPVPKFP